MAGKSYIKTNTYNWSKIKKMYIKTGSTTWTAIRKAYLKTGEYTWKKIYDTSSNAPFILNNDIPKIRLNTYRTDSTSAGAVNPVVAAPPVQFIGPRSGGVQGSATPSPTTGYVGDDGIGAYLWGYDGTWSTTTGVTFTYDWFWADNPDGNTAIDYTPATYSGKDDKISNVAANTGWLVSGEPDGVWLYFRVKAASAGGTGQAISTPVRLIRQEPVVSTWSMQSPSASQLNVPKYITTDIKNLWYNAPHHLESKIEWFSELSSTSPLLNSSTLVKTETIYNLTATSEASGTAITEQPSYTPVNVNSKGYSDANRYIFAKITLINSWTKYTGIAVEEITKTTVPVGQVRTYTPQWNEYITVSTNGYIGLGGASNISAVDDTSTIGHVVSFLNKDLKQIHLKYYSDSVKYIVDYAGKLYNVTSDTITYRYQAHFYPGQNYVDFYVINNAGGTSANAYLYDGDQQVAWGSSKPTGDAYRIYLTSGVAFGTIAYNPRSTTTGFTNITTNNQVDDGETSLQLLQGVSAPENTQRPIFQLLSGTADKVGSTYRLPSGSWINSPTEYNYYLVKNDINGTEVANSGWTTATYFDYTFTAATTQSVAGIVYARNAGGDSFAAISTESIGPFTFLDATAPTLVSAANNGSTDTVTVSWSGASNATRYRIYWNSNGIIPGGGAASNYDEEKIVDGTVITSTGGSWAWGPADPDRNTYVPSGRGNNYFMVSASSDGVTWTTYVVTSTSTGVVLPVPVNTAIPTLTPTGTYNVGDTLTFGVGSWSNSPTSYSLKLYRGTAGVATSETLVKDAGNVTSSTYTILASDYSLGRYYFRAFASATNSGGTSNGGTLTAGVEGGPLNQPLSSPTPSSVTYGSSTFNVYFSGGSGPAYQVWYQRDNAVLFGTDAGTGDAQGTSSPVTRSLTGIEGSTYYWWVRSAKTTTSSGTGNVSAWSGPVSVTIPITPRIPTISMAANTGITTTGGTINWTSTNQASFSSNGTFSGTGTTGTSISKTGLTASTTYTGTVTVTSSTGNTASANYSLTTSAPAATYTITYNGNGATGGSTLPQTGNGTVTLRANGFTRTNCTFQGWATSSGGAVSYPAGFSYSLTANVTLYAVWAAVTNSANAPVVTFLGTSGSGSSTTRSWSWTGGAVTGGTATGWQYSISSTSGTSGFGAFSATQTAASLTVTASTPRWLKVRRVYTDGLGVTKTGPTNNPGV